MTTRLLARLLPVVPLPAHFAKRISAVARRPRPRAPLSRRGLGSLALGAALLCGCSFSNVQARSRGIYTQEPSNVAVYLSVTQDGKPATGLKADDFTVYEDNKLVPPSHSKQILLDKELARAHRTLVLVDNSAATDEEVREELASALSFFVERVRATQPVSVYAFDGRENLRLVADLPRRKEGANPKKRFFQRLLPADTSRNLNGAIVQGIEKLDEYYDRSKAPLRAGTLVVFSGGPDLAGRVSESEVRGALKQTDYTILTVGVGNTAPVLQDYGRDGFVDGYNVDTVSMAFEEAGHLVEADYERHYLFSYCSPARSGQRELRLEVEVTNDRGKTDTGAVYGQFNADGFREGCNPQARPRFQKAASQSASETP